MSARQFDKGRIAKLIVNSLLLLIALANSHCSTSIDEERNEMYSDNVITNSCVLPSRRFDTPVLSAVAGEALTKGNTLISHWPSGPTDNLVWKSRTPYYFARPGLQDDREVYVGVALNDANLGEPVKYAVTGMLVDVLIDVTTLFGGNPVPPGTLITLTDEDQGEAIGLARFWNWPSDNGVIVATNMMTVIGHLACAYDPGAVEPALETDYVPLILHPFVIPWVPTPE
jgi:hypothetical protein